MSTWGSKDTIMTFDGFVLSLIGVNRQESELAINIKKATSIGTHMSRFWLARLVANT